MIRLGSGIIMDNGGSAGYILDSIVRSGNKYLTIVKINVSDDKRILEEYENLEYVKDGVCCIRHTFDVSGHTTYLYFSLDNWYRSLHAAKRSVKKMVDAVRTYGEGTLRKSDFVITKRNILADVSVKVLLQRKLDFTEEEIEGLVNEAMSTRSGIFKLESSGQLTGKETLDKYRARVTVEHLIHSLKRVTGIKPLRV